LTASSGFVVVVVGAVVDVVVEVVVVVFAADPPPLEQAARNPSPTTQADRPRPIATPVFATNDDQSSRTFNKVRPLVSSFDA
jgi:hypothetical protein